MLSLSGCLSRLGGVMISSILLTIATNNIYTMTMSWHENAFCITGPLWDERNAPSLVESPHRPTSKRDLYVAVDLRRHGAYPYVPLQWLANNKQYGCCHWVHALMRLHCNVKSSPWLIRHNSYLLIYIYIHIWLRELQTWRSILSIIFKHIPWNIHTDVYCLIFV